MDIDLFDAAGKGKPITIIDHKGNRGSCYISEFKESISDCTITIYPANKKPTLGIKPRKFWIEERIDQLAEAMRKRLDAGQDFPQKWLDEYNDLVVKYNEKYGH